MSSGLQLMWYRQYSTSVCSLEQNENICGSSAAPVHSASQSQIKWKLLITLILKVCNLENTNLVISGTSEE